MKGNQRLQRSLSGSQISSSSPTTATSSIGFQRPKLSCIICEKNVCVICFIFQSNDKIFVFFPNQFRYRQLKIEQTF